jgi:hypothetical protein
MADIWLVSALDGLLMVVKNGAGLSGELVPGVEDDATETAAGEE